MAQIFPLPVRETLRRVNASMDWLRYSTPLIRSMASVNANRGNLHHSIYGACEAPTNTLRDIRLSWALHHIAQMRDELDTLELLVVQAMEEVKRGEG